MPWNNAAPDVLMVERARLNEIAGMPWGAACDAVGSEHVHRIDYGYTTREEDRADWKPPTNPRTNRPALYLPLNHAWLREIDGRAFVYLQNW